MGQRYHDAQRELQDRFDSRRLADRLDPVTTDVLGDEYRSFVEARDMFFLATADEHGAPQCSYKGGVPELSPLRPPLRAGAALTLRAFAVGRTSRSRLEAQRVLRRCPSRRRPARDADRPSAPATPRF